MALNASSSGDLGLEGSGFISCCLFRAAGT